ncbi:unnamed protein product [Lupinus luteus]|uniref:F-box associated domain-containing protein n=1 Tax=Lupinus luteus TaxID=3873 RepID=A0AAV1YKJ2_LUPLU
MNTIVVYAKLYDLNTDSWFDILDIRDSYADVCDVKVGIGRCGAYSNGVYHWLSADYTCIICFDFRSNKFRTIETPSTMDYGQIIEANNCIAYIVYSYHVADDTTNNWAEIWNLKQDGSWVKQCNIALPQACVNFIYPLPLISISTVMWKQ